MPSLKSLRMRIASVKSTRKITRAMQLVAAAKLRRAQEAALAARPYAERMETVLANLASSLRENPGAPRLLVGMGADKTHLLVVATAERGLCGSFNSAIVRLARRRLEALIAEGKTVKILCVGKKARDQLRRLYGEHILETIELSQVRELGYANAAAIAGNVIKRFEAGEFDIATLFYAQYKSVVTQIPMARQLIPVELPAGQAPKAIANRLGGAIYEYEPSEEDILRDLLPRNVAVQILRALLENAASFYGAQMTAMDSATRNAGDMIDRLTLVYNRTRQAFITKELIEIISGAEAL
jgi:F-type H+-transporting ATPase subunit gamma